MSTSVIANETDRASPTGDACLTKPNKALFEFVITSDDQQFNQGLMKALSGADNLIGVHGLKSIFERVYHTETEAVAVIRRGCETDARHRLEKALHSRIPFAKEVGLRMFIRKQMKEEESNDKTTTEVPGN